MSNIITIGSDSTSYSISGGSISIQGLTFTKKQIAYLFNITTNALLHAPSVNFVDSGITVVGNVITPSTAPSDTDELHIQIWRDIPAYDEILDVLKQVEQAPSSLPANSWLELVNATGMAIGTTYYPIYWNAGHRNIDLTVDSFDTSTDIKISVFITSNPNASTTTDPATDNDWKCVGETLLGICEMDETYDSVYSVTNNLCPAMLIFKVVVGTTADGQVNIRYRTY